jgi:hypothetical protein
VLRGSIIHDPPLAIEAPPAFAVCSATAGDKIVFGESAGLEYSTKPGKLHYSTESRTQYTTKVNRLHISTSGRTEYKTEGRFHYTLEND